MNQFFLSLNFLNNMPIKLTTIPKIVPKIKSGMLLLFPPPLAIASSSLYLSLLNSSFYFVYALYPITTPTNSPPNSSMGLQMIVPKNHSSLRAE